MFCEAPGCQDVAVAEVPFCTRHEARLPRTLKRKLEGPCRVDALLACQGLCALGDEKKPTGEMWRAMAVML